MAYTDFEFYTTTYHGNVVPEADFPRLADRASDFLDVITFERLVDGLPEDERAPARGQDNRGREQAVAECENGLGYERVCNPHGENEDGGDASRVPAARC